MESRIGSVLRETRKRRGLEIAEIETATRIRARFLRAIENEEWDVLPGGVYSRGFIRTYASFLGLDGQRLAEDFRREVEGDSLPSRRSQAREAAPVTSGSLDARGPAPYLRWLAVPAVLLVAVIAIVAVPGDDDGGGASEGGQSALPGQAPPAKAKPEKSPVAAPDTVSVQLRSEAEVWVCVLDAKERHLVDGQILAAGEEEGPFRSDSFTLSFGNGEVTMLIDGKQAEIPATSSPIGYSIDSSGELSQLSDAERPTCT